MDGGQCNALENCTRPVLAIEYSIFFHSDCLSYTYVHQRKTHMFFSEKTKHVKKIPPNHHLKIYYVQLTYDKYDTI